MSAAVECHDLFCLYDAPTGSVARCAGLSLRVPTGERLVVHGPNRIRQVHAARGALCSEVAPARAVRARRRRRARPRRRRHLHRAAPRPPRSRRPALATVAAPRARRARQRRAAAARLAGCSKRESRDAPAKRWPCWGSSTSPYADPGRCRAARRSASRSPPPPAHRPAVVPPTSRPAARRDRSRCRLRRARVRRRRPGRDLVLVTHDPPASRVADRVVRIRDGRLSEQWDPQHRTPRRSSSTTAAGCGCPTRCATAPARAAARSRSPPPRACSCAAPARRSRWRSDRSSSGPRPTTTPSWRPCATWPSYDGVPVLDGLDLDVHASTLAVVSDGPASASRRCCGSWSASPRPTAARWRSSARLWPVLRDERARYAAAPASPS